MGRKRDKTKLDQLCRITEIAWAAAGQELRACLAAERETGARLAALARSREANLALLADPDQTDAATFLSVSAWMRWYERERQRLNLELARNRSALAAEQAKARRAFGRQEAARRLREKG